MSLVNAADGTIDRFDAQATWKAGEERYSLRTFTSEAGLEEFLSSERRSHLITRWWLPRIRFWNMMYWPPSQRVADIIKDRMEAFQRGLIPDPRPFNFAELEGSDLGAAWEPISSDYSVGTDEAA